LALPTAAVMALLQAGEVFREAGQDDDALRAFDIQGLKHNIPAVLAILDSDAFRSGDVHTGIVQDVLARPKAKA